jgi:hypothetical protein
VLDQLWCFLARINHVEMAFVSLLSQMALGMLLNKAL